MSELMETTVEADAVKNPRVLIIEDDPGHQRLLEICVHSAGCQTDCCFDGKTGFAKSQSAHYDLILVDINIPELDGFMVATLLRERGDKTPLVAISALELQGIRRKAMAVGFNDFLQKPIEQETIGKTIRQYIFSHSQPAAG